MDKKEKKEEEKQKRNEEEEEKLNQFDRGNTLRNQMDKKKY